MDAVAILAGLHGQRAGVSGVRGLGAVDVPGFDLQLTDPTAPTPIFGPNVLRAVQQGGALRPGGITATAQAGQQAATAPQPPSTQTKLILAGIGLAALFFVLRRRGAPAPAAVAGVRRRRRRSRR